MKAAGLIVAVLLLVACAGEPTTSSPARVADISNPVSVDEHVEYQVQSQPTLASSAKEVKQAAQELFDNLSAAIEAKDAATYRDLLVADLRERCTVEQLQVGVESGHLVFPEVEVRAVYLDAADPNRALA